MNDVTNIKNEEDKKKKIFTKPNTILTDKWRLVPAYLKVKGLVKQHIDSFNNFIHVEMDKIVKANQMVVSEADPIFFLKYLSIRVDLPTMDDGFNITRPTNPQECRLRDTTYSAPIIADVIYTRGPERVRRNDVVIGRMPIMLKSSKCQLCDKNKESLLKMNECPLDPGGYFIIRGQEKVILIQEQILWNRMMTENFNGVIQCQVASTTHEKKSRTIVLKKGDKYYLKHNSMSDDIPIIVLFKAMGIVTDLAILSQIGTDEDVSKLLEPSFYEAISLGIVSQVDALNYLGSKLAIKYVHSLSQRTPGDEAYNILKHTILAHVPVIDDDFTEKATYVSLMLQRVIIAETDKNIFDDRDYYGNKRLEMAGSFMAMLFEDLFKRMNNELKLIADKNIPKIKAAQFDVLKHIRAATISIGLENAIATGNWSIKRFKMERAGVAQVLSRLNYISALGMMTRVNSQFEKTRKVSGPRSLQASQWGMLCPSDTPEGESCGLVKNLSLLTHITTACDEEPVIKAAMTCGVVSMEPINMNILRDKELFVLFVNGRIIGLVNNLVKFVKSFRAIRRGGHLAPFVAIHVEFVQPTIHLQTDGGRLCRPYIIVEDGQPLLKQKHITELKRGLKTFEDLVLDGVIEYLDVNEEANAYIVCQEEEIEPNVTTHLEIEPFTLLGVCASVVPYPHHNQSPRNTYQCAMGKQAMGVIGYNQKKRIDTLMYNIVYPNVPLVTSRAIEAIGYDKLPAGQNAIVAVMSYSGYDIEDALIISKASIDRGYGRCLIYRSSKCAIKRYPNQTYERIIHPPKESSASKGTSYRFDLLDVDGIVSPGEMVSNKQILINREIPSVSNMNAIEISRITQVI